MTQKIDTKARRRGAGRPVNVVASSRRKGQIMGAARECFAEKGFHAAGVADIATAAGVSVANLYQYFASKDDLILAMAEKDLEEDLDLIRQLGEQADFIASLTSTLAGILAEKAMADDYRLRVEIFAEATRNPRVRKALIEMEGALADELAACLRTAQESGMVRNDVAADGLAAVIMRLVDGIYSGAGAGLVDGATLLPAVCALIEGGLRRHI